MNRALEKEMIIFARTVDFKLNNIHGMLGHKVTIHTQIMPWNKKYSFSKNSFLEN